MCISVRDMRWRGWRGSGLALASLTGALAMTACGTVGAQTTPGRDGRLQVAAAFYPLQYVAQQVGGARVDVTNLTRPGAEPHDLELTPQQVGQVETAALAVYEHGFQPAVDQAVSANRHGPVVDAGRAARLVGRDPGESGVGGSSRSDAMTAHDGVADPATEPAGDPHFWQDPTRLARLGTAVAAQLAAIDPAHATAYVDRAAALGARLGELDAELRAGLATCDRRAFVTSHAAFGYLARRYGLRMVAISGLQPDAEPSPARLRDVQDVVRRQGVTTVFYETLVSPKVARTLAHDLGVHAAALDPIEGLAPDRPRGTDYFSLMRANLRALQRANGCT
jgi:zinc transport system substrate-binding protein